MGGVALQLPPLLLALGFDAALPERIRRPAAGWAGGAMDELWPGEVTSELALERDAGRGGMDSSAVRTLESMMF